MSSWPSCLELPEATVSECDGVRYLHLGDTPWVQGAMRVRKPHHLELVYIQRMMAWLMLRPDGACGHAVQLGLGAGAITRFCHRDLRLHTTAVEINPSVIRACRAWFHLPQDDARLSVLEMDAARYVQDAARMDTVDALQIDLYDHDAASPVLDDLDFYAACFGLLRDEGVLSVNLFGRHASFERSLGHLACVFGAPQVRSLQPTKEGNTVVLAIKKGVFPDPLTLALRCESIQTRWSLLAKKWPHMLRPLPS